MQNRSEYIFYKRMIIELEHLINLSGAEHRIGYNFAVAQLRTKMLKLELGA